MAKRVKFTLNRKALQDQILYAGNVDLEDVLKDALGGGDDVVIEASNNARGGGRIRARVYGSLEDEAATGALSRRLG